LPNIKYLRLPGVQKTDPIGKEVLTKVISIEDIDYNKPLNEEIISAEEVPIQLLKPDSIEKNRSLKNYLLRKRSKVADDQPAEDTGKSEEEDISKSSKEKKERRFSFIQKNLSNPNTNIKQY